MMKNERNLTVSTARRSYETTQNVPALVLQGIWLQELGFQPGDLAHIECSDGKLTITRQEKKNETSPEAVACIDHYRNLPRKEKRLVMQTLRERW